MKHIPVLLGLAAVAVCRFAAAQTPPPAMVPCTRMSDPAERLSCYDKQMTAMGATVAGPVAPAQAPGVGSAAPAAAGSGSAVTRVPPPAPPAPAPPAPGPDSRFGQEDLKEAARPKADRPSRVLESQITSIKELRPKLYVIVLANGQIWLQEGTQITSFFKAGYDARIEKGLLGDYRMSTAQTGDQNMVRVTRLQ